MKRFQDRVAIGPHAMVLAPTRRQNAEPSGSAVRPESGWALVGHRVPESAPGYTHLPRALNGMIASGVFDDLDRIPFAARPWSPAERTTVSGVQFAPGIAPSARCTSDARTFRRAVN